MITITINSIDRTLDIEQFSLRYSDTKTKAPKKISFAIKGEKVFPAIGQSVTLTKDSQPLFAGTIVSRTEELLGSGLRRYVYECHDGFFGMDGRLVIKAYNDTTLGAVATDIITNFTSGFTIDVPATTPAVKTVRFNYEQPTTCLRKLCDAVGWDWYVDASNVVHIAPPGSTAAPYVADEVSGHIIPKTLNFDRNILELKNVVYVRGGEYEAPIAAVDAVDKYEANGIDNTFPLVYRYGETQVTVNGVAQTVGVDFLDDPLDFDCLYNYQEKLVRFPDGTLSAGQIVRVFGNAKVPLIVQAEDSASVLAYGVREHVEIDKSINSTTEAEVLAGARLDQWREGSREGSFESYKDGWAVGQTVRVTSIKFGVDEDYIVNRVTAVQHTTDTLKYTIEFIKSGQTELTDMLIALIGESKKNVVIADNEVLQRLLRVSDNFGVNDEIVSVIKTTGPYAFTPVTTKTAGKFNFSVFS